MASDEELALELKELRDQLGSVLKLKKPQLEQVDEWIDLAKKAQTARQAWDQAEGIDKGKAQSSYIEAKSLFENAIRGAKGGTDETLAQAAKAIENRTHSNDILETAKKEFLDSALDRSREKPYHDMSDGDLLAELLFKIFGLMAAGTHGLQYLYNQGEETKALKDLAKEDGAQKDGAQNSDTDLFSAKKNEAKDVMPDAKKVTEEFDSTNLFSLNPADLDLTKSNEFTPKREQELANTPSLKPELPKGRKPTDEQEKAAESSKTPTTPRPK